MNAQNEVGQAAESFNETTLLTSSQVAGLLQVNRASVNNWVRDGRLEAFRTPGGHHRIRVSDLVAFLSTHELPIPPRLQPLLKRKILIVDDDKKQLAALRRGFRSYKSNAEVETVENGMDALVRIGAFSPDVIFLDVFMPGIDGVEACKRLRTMTATKNTKIYLVTGEINDELLADAERVGADDCLQKPISALSLASLLNIKKG